MPKVTQVEFLRRAVACHGSKYDYSAAVFLGTHSALTIICPLHGSFSQIAKSHTTGQGCPACGLLKNADARRSSLARFVQQAQAIHGIKYDYKLVEYWRNGLAVNIICPKHGVFKQRPDAHIHQQQGCPQCGNEAAGEGNTLGWANFLPRAQAVHGAKYNYAQAEFRNLDSKIAIICPKHGLFKQRAASHLLGRGCPACGREAMLEAAKLGWVAQANGRLCYLYLVRIFSQTEQFYKVGITCHSVGFRFRQKSHLGDYEYEVLAVHKSSNALAVFEWEQSILETFKNLHYKPSRYFVGRTECFSSCDEILAIFPL